MIYLSTDFFCANYFFYQTIILAADLFKQPGRVAVITGGNRGIGADVVEKLLNCDISVVMGRCFFFIQILTLQTDV